MAQPSGGVKEALTRGSGSRPRTRSILKAEEENKMLVEQEKKAKEKKEPDDGIRRSSRNHNSIRLKGTAPTFYRRLQTLFFSQPKDKSYQTIGGNRIHLQKVHDHPHIYTIDNFLSPSELEYFDQLIASQSCPFEKSFVDNMEYDDQHQHQDEINAATNHNKTDKDIGKQQQQQQKQAVPKKQKRKRRTLLDSTHRTSTFFGFKKLHDVRIAGLEQKVANLMGCWVHQIEALQLVRYLPGQFFGIHHDMGDLLDNDEVTLPRKLLDCKRRLVTLFCYLNTLDKKKKQGGCTYFPKCRLRVPPKRGQAVLWSNVTAEGLPDPLTIHAGEAIKGSDDVVKYGLNIWICEE